MPPRPKSSISRYRPNGVPCSGVPSTVESALLHRIGADGVDLRAPRDVGDDVVETGGADLVRGIHGDLVLDAGDRHLRAVTGDGHGVANAADRHSGVIAGDRLVLV